MYLLKPNLFVTNYVTMNLVKFFSPFVIFSFSCVRVLGLLHVLIDNATRIWIENIIIYDLQALSVAR